MRPIEFKEQTCVFAEDQPEYLPLPAFKSDDGQVISCWKFSFWETLKILWTGKMWFHVFTFNQPLQPQRPTLDYPFEIKVAS